MRSARNRGQNPNATHITAADEAAVKVARRLAAELDILAGDTGQGALFEAGEELSGKVAYLASTLLMYLKALQLTPEARGATAAQGSDDPLSRLRSQIPNANTANGG